MGFQVVVDLDPPGVRDPVLISLSFVLATACIRLRFAPAERRRDMWRSESGCAHGCCSTATIPVTAH